RLSAREREQLSVAHHSGLRLFRLFNMLLDLARLDHATGPPALTAMDLAQFTVSMLEPFGPVFEQAGVRLLLACDAVAAPVLVEPEMWEKIVLQLLSNAFKFTRDGVVEVVLRALPTWLELSVRDTGIGIRPDAMDRIFDRFFRIDEPLARSQE